MMANKQVEEFVITVEYYPDENQYVRAIISVNDCPFIFWMCACEYLIHITAQKSNAGYEKALELLAKGAMTYKNQALKDKQ